MTLQAKNLDSPDETRTFEHGAMHLVELPSATIGRTVFHPGWRWSTDIKPVVSTDSCQAHHISYVVSGHFHIQMDDGSELDVGPGDAFVIGPGHDAWVIGEEDLVTIDFAPTTSG
jgi:mannose-6-phosphate isomerase-like protein (cupin superfamily)